ncbi:hypothetical protein FOA52_000227 [Chlamydomonas sp. UWO 241]|nr:hypothetical protein FOA52_000227 [Chlamydomonas sp. UWO 241]
MLHGKGSRVNFSQDPPQPADEAGRLGVSGEPEEGKAHAASQHDVKKNAWRKRAHAGAVSNKLACEFSTLGLPLSRSTVEARLTERSLGLLPKANWLRRPCIDVVLHKYFDWAVLVVIFANCVCLALDSDSPGFATTGLARGLYIANLCFLITFSLEAAIKIVALGVVIDELTYLRDPWNVMDMLILLLGWIELLGYGNFMALRVVRALRVLRTISKVPKLKALVVTIIRSLPMLANVLVLAAIFFVLFGAIGIELMGMGALRGRCGAPDFSGALSFVDNAGDIVITGITYTVPSNQESDVCQAPHTSAITWYNTSGTPTPAGVATWSGRVCPYEPEDNASYPYGLWCVPTVNPGSPGGYRHFDNAAYGWLTLFLFTATQDWSSVMYDSQDGVSQYIWPLMVLQLLLAVVLTNLFLAVLYVQFTKHGAEFLGSTKQHLGSTEEGGQAGGRGRLRWHAASGRVRENLQLTDAYAKPPASAGAGAGLDAATGRLRWTLASGRVVESMNVARMIERARAAAEYEKQRGDQQDDEGEEDEEVEEEPEVITKYEPYFLGTLTTQVSGILDDDALADMCTTVLGDSSGEGSADGSVQGGGAAGGAGVGGEQQQAQQAQQGQQQAQQGQQAQQEQQQVQQQGQQQRQQPGVDDAAAVGGGGPGPDASAARVRRPAGPSSGTQPTPAQLSIALAAAALSAKPPRALQNGGHHHHHHRQQHTLLVITRSSLYASVRRGRGMPWTKRVRATCYRLQLTDWLNRAVLINIVASSLLMAMYWYPQPTAQTKTVEYGNYVFTVLFVVEMVVKVLGLGVTGYCYKNMNLFDGLVTVFSVIDMVLGLSGAESGGLSNGFAAARSLRLIRLFRLAESWSGLQRILDAFMVSAPSIGWLTLLLLLFLVTGALVGMQLFGYRIAECALVAGSSQQCFEANVRACPSHWDCYVPCTVAQVGTWFNVPGSPYGDQAFCAVEVAGAAGGVSSNWAQVGKSVVPSTNFDSFWRSFLTLFQILTLDDVNVVQYYAMAMVGEWACTYFVITILLGRFVVLNLFLAILLDGFVGLEHTPEDKEDLLIQSGALTAGVQPTDDDAEGAHPLPPGGRTRGARSSGVSRRVGSTRGSNRLDPDEALLPAIDGDYDEHGRRAVPFGGLDLDPAGSSSLRSGASVTLRGRLSSAFFAIPEVGWGAQQLPPRLYLVQETSAGELAGEAPALGATAVLASWQGLVGSGGGGGDGGGGGGGVDLFVGGGGGGAAGEGRGGSAGVRASRMGGPVGVATEAGTDEASQRDGAPSGGTVPRGSHGAAAAATTDRAGGPMGEATEADAGEVSHQGMAPDSSEAATIASTSQVGGRPVGEATEARAPQMSEAAAITQFRRR